MTLDTSPVGATADCDRVEERLTEHGPVEQRVDGATLPYHPYRVIHARQDAPFVVVLRRQAQMKSGNADVPGVEDQRGLS